MTKTQNDCHKQSLRDTGVASIGAKLDDLEQRLQILEEQRNVLERRRTELNNQETVEALTEYVKVSDDIIKIQDKMLSIMLQIGTQQLRRQGWSNRNINILNADTKNPDLRDDLTDEEDN